jgi:hypothetical protein
MASVGRVCSGRKGVSPNGGGGGGGVMEVVSLLPLHHGVVRCRHVTSLLRWW